MMRKSRKNRAFSKFCLHILGLLLCILPPAACTLCYFPLWRYDSGKTVVGAVALLLTLSAMPLFKLMKRRLDSVASYVLWLALFLLFFLLARIADEMTVISFYGFIGNLLGAIVMRVADGKRETYED